MICSPFRIEDAAPRGAYPYTVSRVRFCMLFSRRYVQSVSWRRLRHSVLQVLGFCLLFIGRFIPSFCLPSCRVSMFGGGPPNDFRVMIFTYFAFAVSACPGFFVDCYILFRRRMYISPIWQADAVICSSANYIVVSDVFIGAIFAPEAI